MECQLESSLLEASLDAWMRNNEALLNLLKLTSPDGLNARIFDDSKKVCQMFWHIYHERMVSVLENAPEYAGPVPADEWHAEVDPSRLASVLQESAVRVRTAVEGRIRAGKAFDCSFSHPIQLLFFMIFHEGYHHGQIKSALKRIGQPILEDEAGPMIWDVWKAR